MCARSASTCLRSAGLRPYAFEVRVLSRIAISSFGHRQHDSVVERHRDLFFRAPGEEEQVSIRYMSEQRRDRTSAPPPPPLCTRLAEAVIVGVVRRVASPSQLLHK